jgi:TPP-dependent pyruvate/acetoin dehydrogenase alpha subunit
MTYRGGHHSTSDDATRYRGKDEVSLWSTSNNPIARMKMFLEKRYVEKSKYVVWNWSVETYPAAAHASISFRKWLEEGLEEQFREEAKVDVLACLEAAEGKKKQRASQLFADVYAELPKHLGKCIPSQNTQTPA